MTLYDCAVGHPDCSRCQAANRSLGCLWCSHGRPGCRYGPLCPPGAVELLCPTPSIDAVSPQPLCPPPTAPWPTLSPPPRPPCRAFHSPDLTRLRLAAAQAPAQAPEP